jgi:hypothetical protein
MFAVNVVNFLNQNPASVDTDIVDVQHAGEVLIINIDVGITHPFPGNVGFNGYDVRGIFMGNGSVSLVYNPDLIYPDFDVDQSIGGIDGDFTDAPDGYTRWFNATEFSTGGMPLFSYAQGNKATPGYSPTATLSPYHYYADGLGATESAAEWLASNPDSNGVFSAGSKNIRRYAVRFPTAETKVKFGYAVTANWEGLNAEFHPSNAPEAVAADATITPDIYFNGPGDFGGSIISDLTLYSWAGQPSTIVIESPVLSSPYALSGAEMEPVDSGENYATWHIEIPADNVTNGDDTEFWAIAEYPGFNYKNDFGTANLAGDDPLAAYFRFELPLTVNPTGCGAFQWAKRAGGQLNDRGYSITTLSDDSVAVTGVFSHVFCPTDYTNIDATFGSGESNETILTDPKLGDIFVARYASDGNLLWAKRAGGVGFDSGNGITALSDNSIVVCGTFGSNCDGALLDAVFGEDEINETTLSSTNWSGTFFIAKYNPDGILEWAKQAKGEPFYNNEYTQRGSEVTALSDDSIVATGVFGNTAIFGDGEPNETSLTYHPYYWDTFIARYNPDGTLQWAKRVGGTELEESMDITAAPNDSFVITGRFGTQDVKPAIFGEGEPNETTLYTFGRDDIFIASYNPDGTLIWADSAGGSDADKGYGVTCLSDNTIVIGGSYGNGCTGGGCDATFGSGDPNETILVNEGWDDIFLARYSTDGILMWAKRAAGVSQEIITDVDTIDGDLIAVTGEFWATCVFGEGEPNEITMEPYPDTDPNFDYSDIFVAWFNPDGTVYCVKSAGGKSYDNGYAMSALSDGSIVSTGVFAGTYAATFGQGTENEITLSGQGIELFVARWLK